jgi:hypothetical protein
MAGRGLQRRQQYQLVQALSEAGRIMLSCWCGRASCRDVLTCLYHPVCTADVDHMIGCGELAAMVGPWLSVAALA